MFTLSHKPDGGAELTGMQRVFFTCHPDDFDRYFEEITEDIRASQNCVIYYIGKEDEAEYDEKQFLSYLADMRLVVIPVTTNLLTSPSRALDVVYKFAQGHHIPVLTLMQEDGLDELYSRVFGDLQYLNKHSKNETAIPFEKKLSDFLSSVLVGDELAKKVRAAFDAYIFLSYRKDDSVYAQELMRLIHKNGFCRDIAIWYDEYLVPGESFNSAIKAAIEKSSLFTLAVTPNLLEDGNYVMTKEYPMAKGSGKAILPAQVVETDRKELEAKYKGIPECTDAYDAPKLSSSLLAALEGIAKRENDSDQEHNFMIGLAYLTGIDVEVNVDRALGLIMGAAENGLVEAMKKLVDMYRRGDGVERDRLRAIEWQGKLAAAWETRYSESGSDHDGTQCAEELQRLGDYWLELGRLPEAKACYEKALGIDEIIALRTGSVHARRNVSLDYNKLGDIAKAERRLADARKYYEKSFQMFAALASETNTADARRDLSIGYERLGSIVQAEGGMLRDAQKYYEASLQIDEKLAKETKTADARRDLSRSYVHLGDIVQAEGSLDDARGYYEHALQISTALAEETRTADARRSVSVCCSRLGGTAMASGRFDDACKYYEASLNIDAALAAETKTVESRRDMVISYKCLGDIAQVEDKPDDARIYYENALKIAAVLAEETKTLDSYRDLSVCYDRLGNMAEAEERLDDAQEYYGKSLKISSMLADKTKTTEACRDLSLSYNNLGRIAEAKRLLADAREYYGKALSLGIKLAEKTQTAESYDDLAVSYYNLGVIDYPKIDGEYLQRALEIWETLARACPGVSEYRRRCGIVKRLLGGDGD